MVIAICFVDVAGIGFWFSHRQTSTDTYFVARRSIPHWAMGLSIFATIISSITFIAYPGSAYAGNGNELAPGFMVRGVLILVGTIILPFFRQAVGMSAYEYFGHRFGYGARAYSALAFTAGHFSEMGFVLYLLSLTINSMTGWNIYFVLLACGLLTVLYTLIGGLEAVIWTEVVQGIVKGIGVFVIIGILFHIMPGGASAAFQLASEQTVQILRCAATIVGIENPARRPSSNGESGDADHETFEKQSASGHRTGRDTNLRSGLLKMKNGHKYHGAVGPMITPVTTFGELDEAAVDRLVDDLVAGGVEGVFVLGTTGEAANVPKLFRRRLVERAAQRAQKRCLIYVGLGDLIPKEFGVADEYFDDGADAVVAHPPISARVPTHDLAGWYRRLLDQVRGPLILYNMPMTTGVSIPLDAVEQLLGHPRLAGIKDSENNPRRVEELLKRFGGRPGFSVFIGVGALMEKGLKLGADGIVPSVVKLIPQTCQDLCASAHRGDWAEAENHFSRMNAVASLYQNGRTLIESLAVLKAAGHRRGLCAPHVLPPLSPLSGPEINSLRGEMSRLHLLNGKA